MKMVNEVCEVYGERITEEDKIAEIKTGKARSGAWKRWFFGLFMARPRGVAWVHVDCIDESIEYNSESPHVTAKDIVDKLKVGGKTE